MIQDQARELSYLRQKIREGRGICYLLTQHAKDTVKSFEELLRSNDIDYYLGQSFREQLAQGGQLTERLTSKLSTSKLATSMVLGSGGYQSPTAAHSVPAPRVLPVSRVISESGLPRAAQGMAITAFELGIVTYSYSTQTLEVNV